MGNALIFSLLLIVGIFIGAVIAFIITALKKKNEEHKASNIIEKAKKDAEKSKRDALLEAKEESYKLKLETEKEIKLYVKAENGDIKEYTIAIQKVTDLRAESIKVNDTECILENGNYIGFVDRNSKQAGLKIKPKNPTTLISIKTGING